MWSSKADLFYVDGKWKPRSVMWNSSRQCLEPVRVEGEKDFPPSMCHPEGYRTNEQRHKELLQAGTSLAAWRSSKFNYDADDDVQVEFHEMAPVYDDKVGWLEGLRRSFIRFVQKRGKKNAEPPKEPPKEPSKEPSKEPPKEPSKEPPKEPPSSNQNV